MPRPSPELELADDLGINRECRASVRLALAVDKILRVAFADADALREIERGLDGPEDANDAAEFGRIFLGEIRSNNCSDVLTRRGRAPRY